MMCIMFITLLNREVTSMKPPQLGNKDDKCVEMVKGNGEVELKAQRQTNGAVERANALIFEAMKKILEDEKKGKWAELMPEVVWSHNTTVCKETNFTPFRLMYGAEAVLPEEVKHRSLRTAIGSPACPSKAEEKDLLELDRLKAVANVQKYKEETQRSNCGNSMWATWYFYEATALRTPASLRPSGLDYMS
jgi:hypothetical protein